MLLQIIIAPIVGWQFVLVQILFEFFPLFAVGFDTDIGEQSFYANFTQIIKLSSFYDPVFENQIWPAVIMPANNLIGQPVDGTC